jgi:hypothetical protein
MAALLASAKARAAAFDQKNDQDNDAMDDGEDSEEDDENNGAVNVRKDSSRKQFDKVYKQTLFYMFWTPETPSAHGRKRWSRWSWQQTEEASA